MSIGVTRWQTRFMGRRCERYWACGAVLGKPSRMKDVFGSFEGSTADEAEPFPRSRAAMISSLDLSVDIHFLVVSSFRMSPRIKGSGTRPPPFMYDWAFVPVYGLGQQGQVTKKTFLTQSGLPFNMIPKQVSCGQAAELRVPLYQSFALGAFANPRRSNKNDTSSFLQFVCGSAHLAEVSAGKSTRATGSCAGRILWLLSAHGLSCDAKMSLAQSHRELGPKCSAESVGENLVQISWVSTEASTTRSASLARRSGDLKDRRKSFGDP